MSTAPATKTITRYLVMAGNPDRGRVKPRGGSFFSEEEAKLYGDATLGSKRWWRVAEVIVPL